MSSNWNNIGNWDYWQGRVRDATPPTNLTPVGVSAPANAPTVASNPDACQGQQVAPAKLYCPAHGKADIDREPWNRLIFAPEGRPFCPKCVAAALERIGVHQLVEKPPAIVKKW